MESPKKVINEVPVEVTNKRVLRERKDREKVIKRAKSILEDENKKKTGLRSKKMKIIADEKSFLDKLLCDEMLNKFSGRFLNLFFFLLIVLLLFGKGSSLSFQTFHIVLVFDFSL